MKKVSIRDKSFKVIPEAGKVIGEMPLKWISKDLRRGLKPIYRRIIEFGMDTLYPKYSDLWLDFEDLYGSDTVKATATCDKNDTFDEDKGIDLCSAKLELKNHLKLMNAYDRLYLVLCDAAEHVLSMMGEHYSKAESIRRDIAKTYGGEKD